MHLDIQVPQNASESRGVFFNPLHILFGKSIAFCDLGTCKTEINTSVDF